MKMRIFNPTFAVYTPMLTREVVSHHDTLDQLEEAHRYRDETISAFANLAHDVWKTYVQYMENKHTAQIVVARKAMWTKNYRAFKELHVQLHTRDAGWYVCNTSLAR